MSQETPVSIMKTNWLMLFMKICISHSSLCRFTISYSVSPILFPFHFILVLFIFMSYFFSSFTSLLSSYTYFSCCAETLPQYCTGLTLIINYGAFSIQLRLPM